METSCEYMDKVPVPWTQAGYGVSGWLPDICCRSLMDDADRKRSLTGQTFLIRRAFDRFHKVD